MNYRLCDRFELLQDISCPHFNRTLKAGEIIRGVTIQSTYPLAWMNPHLDSFKKFFKYRPDIVCRNCKGKRKENG